MMIDFIKRLFGFCFKGELQIQPKAGDRFALKPNDEDPWGSDTLSSVVTVIDVKNGWVRYSFGGNFFKDCRLKMDSFLYCYKKIGR